MITTAELGGWTTKLTGTKISGTPEAVEEEKRKGKIKETKGDQEAENEKRTQRGDDRDPMTQVTVVAYSGVVFCMCVQESRRRSRSWFDPDRSSEVPHKSVTSVRENKGKVRNKVTWMNK